MPSLGLGLGTHIPSRVLSRLLLDQFGGAAAAYSLRKLSASTTNVVRVRRSSDNAEDDFTAAEVADGTLTTWVGANDGFVRTWYDQSGNARDAGQATTTSQPKIVSAGSLVVDTNGNATILPDGINDFLTNFNSYWDTFVGSDFSTYAVMEKTSDINKLAWTIGNATSDNANWLVGPGGTIGDYLYRGKRVNTSFTGIATSSMGVFSSLDISGGGARIDGVAGTSSSLSNAVIPDRLTIFDRRTGSSTPFSGSISELIYYPSDQSGNNAAIESNIADRYSITLP